ncbi:hypothetical protein AAEX63_01325 [Luteococcus sp. H138]|uniref:hypothetical protein n=1 Tax=unclassified Luteococcus TaxID=2639923 RepID=UPI00313EDDD9
MDMATVRERLYAGEPEDFVATRKGLAREARAAKDRELARQIEALRRPTRAAWLVNLLARAERDRLVEFFGLGEELAELHRCGTPRDIQEMNRRRGLLCLRLVASAMKLANTYGHRASLRTMDEVEVCLQAGLTHPEAGAEMLKGCLVKAPESAAGFPLDLFESVGQHATPGAPAEPRRKTPAAGVIPSHPVKGVPQRPTPPFGPAGEADRPLAPVISLSEARQRHAHPPAASTSHAASESTTAPMAEPSVAGRGDPQLREVEDALAAARAMLAELTSDRDAEASRRETLDAELTAAEAAEHQAAAGATAQRGRVEELAAELARAQAEQRLRDERAEESRRRLEALRREHDDVARRLEQTEKDLEQVSFELQSFESIWKMLHG